MCMKWRGISPKRDLDGGRAGHYPALASLTACRDDEENQTVLATIIYLRHHVDDVAAEAFLGCYLDRVVVS
jgi:hypothetical protein